mmetsp:Transcript_41132/g.66247  ORF Transcript_41132/g.66247 Transcript_41132/m.66247 type:complete len:1159 (+) Transcript_41132:364-3840(+)
MYQNSRTWNAQSVDESEDDEVQGIFGRQHKGSKSTAGDMTGNPIHAEYDDVVHRFSGLMTGQSIFAPDSGAFLEAGLPSQLNANVAAFTPGDGMQGQQVQESTWQGTSRASHRTPGPGESGDGGPSPPNPFRYGLGTGFNYRSGKMGLSPPDFSGNVDSQEQQVFGLNYMEQDPLRMQQANAWYENLPQAGPYAGVNEGGKPNDPQQQLDFSSQFLNVTEEDATAGRSGSFGGFGGFQDGPSSTAFPQSYPPPLNPQQYGSKQEYNFYEAPNVIPGLPSDRQQQQQHVSGIRPPPGGLTQGSMFARAQQQQQGDRYLGGSHLHQQYTPKPIDDQSRYYGQTLPMPMRKVDQPQQQQQQQIQSTGLQYSAALGAPPMQQQQQQIPAHNKQRRSTIEEEERKDRQNVSGKKDKRQQQHSTQRRISGSVDSTRSGTSGSIDGRCLSNSVDSQASRESFATRKKQELEENPHTRSIFKEFYKNFRAKEKESFNEAFAYANQCLESKDIPEKIHWKIYLEMADLAKRENRFEEARKLYLCVNSIQPYAHQGWLEYSKMEEECGRLHQCRMILHQGLEYCNYAEQLLTKAIKHEERMGNLQGARSLLARLRNQSVDKTWRTILEGALLEARAGNIVVARKVFKYLMQHVPWYGPIYFEATKFEEKNEEFERAIAIVEKGLKEIPRYGPLWFNAFRLHEKTEMEAAMKAALKNPQLVPQKVSLLRSDVVPSMNLFEMFGVQGDEFQVMPLTCDLLQTRGALQRAMNCISKELVWKVHFEAAQVAERGGGADSLARARHAYVQSILRCPVNLRWKVWLAGARTELSGGNISKARQLLDRALQDVPSKSKPQVLLECSRLAEYMGVIKEARSILQRARKETRHEWKVFLESVMLEIRNGKREDAIRAAEDALAIHSGTGRLWAILVQLKHVHGPDAQRLVFREALKQVPKSGEVWCEGARVHMHPLSPHMDLNTAERYLEFAIQFTPQYGDSFIEALRWQLLYCTQENIITDSDDEETFRNNMLKCDTSELELRCVNADPNYGALWFHCKRGPFDTARQVLRTAKKLLIAELTKFRSVYREGILDSLRRKNESQSYPSGTSKARTTPALASGENVWLTERLHKIPGSSAYVNFSTGLLSVNWLRENVNILVDSERRKFLFGSDQIVP